jgi:hypothetical protein
MTFHGWLSTYHISRREVNDMKAVIVDVRKKTAAMLCDDGSIIKIEIGTIQSARRLMQE